MNWHALARVFLPSWNGAIQRIFEHVINNFLFSRYKCVYNFWFFIYVNIYLSSFFYFMHLYMGYSNSLFNYNLWLLKLFLYLNMIGFYWYEGCYHSYIHILFYKLLLNQKWIIIFNENYVYVCWKMNNTRFFIIIFILSKGNSGCKLTWEEGGGVWKKTSSCWERN